MQSLAYDFILFVSLSRNGEFDGSDRSKRIESFVFSRKTMLVIIEEKLFIEREYTMEVEKAMDGLMIL